MSEVFAGYIAPRGPRTRAFRLALRDLASVLGLALGLTGIVIDGRALGTSRTGVLPKSIRGDGLKRTPAILPRAR